MLRNLMLATMLSGCAAAHASAAVMQGQAAVRRAEAADPAARAVYERTLAQAYLAEARAQAALSSYRTSADLARKAREWADRATAAAAEPPR
jgi:hypothetical protein